MQVDHAIIHKLVKDPHGKTTVHKRSTALTLSNPVLKLVTDIHELYTKKPSKGHGRFEADETNFPTAKILRNAFKDGGIAFADASQQLLDVLAAKADQAPLATGGYVLMAEVSELPAVRWFIIAIINNVGGNAIVDASLEVVDTIHVDLENLRVAGRVNLSDWLSGDEKVRYVGFLKHRGEVSEYFKLFLGCKELIANSEETKKIVTILRNFASANNLENEKREEFLTSAHSFFQDHSRANKPLSLESLSNAIWPEKPEVLQTVLATSEAQLSDGFVPDSRVIQLLVKIKARTPYWSVNLDRSALLTGNARYDKKRGELVLLNLPDGLTAQLDEELGNAI